MSHKRSSSKNKTNKTTNAQVKSQSQKDQQNNSDHVVDEFEQLPPEKKEAVFSAIFKGPIPPASELEAYENIMSGAADRIFQMAENESEHRRKQEEKMVDSSCGDSRLGLWLGFLIGITVIIVSGTIAIFSNAFLGSLLAFFSLSSLVGVFVYGSKQKRKNASEEEVTQTKDQ